MATLAKSAVALYNVATTGFSAAEFKANSAQLITRRLTLTLTGQGGQTNTITAHALGFGTLVSCGNLFDDTNNLVYAAVVDPVTNTINLNILEAGTTADVTCTGYITVTGTRDNNMALT